tara:strand:+ start:1422 stop:1937 length:516 start_codon:yes stop_codon:yes gene_type:complete
MHKIEFIENIPQIPEELLTYNIEEIATMKNQFGDSKVQSYSTHNVSDDLYDFLRPYLGNNIQIRYQIMRKQLPIHIDAHVLSGMSHVFNYVLLAGGEDIKTRWWEVLNKDQLMFVKDRPRKIIWGDEQDKKQLLHEIVIPLKRWHNLQINIPHDISKIDTPRLGITAFESK